MARDYRCLAIELQELFEYAFHDHFVVAAGMVGAADGTGKEAVAAEEKLTGPLEIADSPN